EFSALNFDWLFESALFASATTINIEDVTATIAAGATQTLTGSANDFDTVPVGATIKIAGAAASDNNGLKAVVAKSTDGSTLTFAAGAFAAAESGATLTLSGKHLRNGTTRRSATFERKIITTAGTDFFQSYLGMVVDTAALRF